MGAGAAAIGVAVIGSATIDSAASGAAETSAIESSKVESSNWARSVGFAAFDELNGDTPISIPSSAPTTRPDSGKMIVDSRRLGDGRFLGMDPGTPLQAQRDLDRRSHLLCAAYS
jgi:hypothetical protein